MNNDQRIKLMHAIMDSEKANMMHSFQRFESFLTFTCPIQDEDNVGFYLLKWHDGMVDEAWVSLEFVDFEKGRICVVFDETITTKPSIVNEHFFLLSDKDKMKYISNKIDIEMYESTRKIKNFKEILRKVGV